MQKVSLARMLVIDPKIMLMDEPLAHLNAPTKRTLRLELRRFLIGTNVPSVYVTHFEDDALADYVAILQDGQLEYTGKIETLPSSQNDNRFPFVSKMFDEANYLEGEVTRSNDGITTFSIGSNMIEIIGNNNIGSRVGILVKPEDIILSREIIRTSACNIVKAQIINIINYRTREGGGVVDIHLKAGKFHIITRITEQAMIDLGLHSSILAIFKASSPQINRED
jgi:ABC-type molybdate transport system ATPase subunit